MFPFRALCELIAIIIMDKSFEVFCQIIKYIDIIFSIYNTNKSGLYENLKLTDIENGLKMILPLLYARCTEETVKSMIIDLIIKILKHVQNSNDQDYIESKWIINYNSFLLDIPEIVIQGRLEISFLENVEHLIHRIFYAPV